MSETMAARNRRDERTADEVVAERSLMCIASGCPNRWSVDGGSGKLCSAHAWAQPLEWPWITHQQLEAQTERARRGPPERVQTEPFTRERRAEILRKLRELAAQPKPGRQWAYALRDREEAGERLTLFQREAWRIALHGAEEPA